MRIGIMDMTVNRGTLADVRLALEDAADMGAASFWVPNFFGLDALTTLAVVAADLPDIAVGTAVVPILGRTPRVLAQQARTVHAALGARLTLGVGLSHRPLVEGAGETWPSSPAEYFRTYLSELTALCTPTDTADRTPSDISIETSAPLSVLAASLGPRMLDVAGQHCDGVVLWCIGPVTLSQFTVPILRAGPLRPLAVLLRESSSAYPSVSPTTRWRCAVGSPDNSRQFDRLPSYRSSLAREGVASLADIAIVGDPDEVREGIARFQGSGATDLICNSLIATPGERVATRNLLADILSEGRAA